MERHRCSLSVCHASTHQCMCASPPVLLCSRCVTAHCAEPGEHLVTKQPNTAHDSPPMCQICEESLADEFCCCRFPVASLCKMCRLVHFQRNSGDSHFFLPIACREKVTNEQEAVHLLEKLLTLTKAKDYVQQSVERITECQKAIQSRGEFWSKSIENYCNSQVHELETLKSVLASSLTSASETVRDQVLEQDIPGDALAALLWTCTQTSDFHGLDFFQFESVEGKSNVDELVGVVWRSRIEPSGVVTAGFAYSNARSLIVDGEQAQGTTAYDTEETASVMRYKQEIECVKVSEKVVNEMLSREYDLGSVVDEAKSEFRKRCEGIPKSIVFEYQEKLEKSMSFSVQAKSELKRTIESMHKRPFQVAIPRPIFDPLKLSVLLLCFLLLSLLHTCGAVQWLSVQLCIYAFLAIIAPFAPAQIAAHTSVIGALLDVTLCSYAVAQFSAWDAQCLPSNSLCISIVQFYLCALLLTKAAFCTIPRAMH